MGLNIPTPPASTILSPSRQQRGIRTPDGTCPVIRLTRSWQLAAGHIGSVNRFQVGDDLRGERILALLMGQGDFAINSLLGNVRITRPPLMAIPHSGAQ
jgi:hypothetical protein